MKKATMFTIYLGLYIIALFSVGIAFTYINDWLQLSGFFGDTLTKPDILPIGYVAIDKNYEWGARHYWYFWMCVLLFILSVIRIIMWAFWYWEDKN